MSTRGFGTVVMRGAKTTPRETKDRNAAKGLPAMPRKTFEKAKDGTQRGRPTALTPKVWDFIMEQIALGVPETLIGPMIPKSYGGPLGRPIVGEWRKQGEEDIKASKASVFAEFANALIVADEMAEDSHIGYILKAQVQHWQAAKYLREQRIRRRLGLAPIDLPATPPTPPDLPTLPGAPGAALSEAEREAALRDVRRVLEAKGQR